MFNEFKSLELFRHQVSSRVDKSLKQYADQSKENAEKIVSMIFSACASLLIAYLSHSYIEKDDPIKALIFFAFFIIIFVFLFFLSRWVSKKVESVVYNIKHHGSQL